MIEPHRRGEGDEDLVEVDQVYGQEVQALPDGWCCVGVVVMAKCFDETGELQLCSSVSETITPWEALGMLDVEHRSQRREIARDDPD